VQRAEEKCRKRRQKINGKTAAAGRCRRTVMSVLRWQMHSVLSTSDSLSLRAAGRCGVSS